jgi:hypothetical protein
MPDRRGPIPPKDADFNTYINTAIPYLQANDARLGVSGPNVNALVGFLNDWNVLFPKTKDRTQRTPALTEEKNKLRDKIETLLRKVYADIPESALTTNDRNKLNLPERDTVPTDTELPDNPPNIDLKDNGVSFQKVLAHNFEDPDFDGKPDGVNLINAAWHIGDNPPAHPKDFDNDKDFSTALFKIQFDAVDSGKKVRIAIRYIGNRGQEGPWSKAISVGIT